MKIDPLAVAVLLSLVTAVSACAETDGSPRPGEQSTTGDKLNHTPTDGVIDAENLTFTVRLVQCQTREPLNFSATETTALEAFHPPGADKSNSQNGGPPISTRVLFGRLTLTTDGSASTAAGRQKGGPPSRSTVSPQTHDSPPNPPIEVAEATLDVIPGCYEIDVVPVDGQGQESEDCESEEDRAARVRDGQTTELVLVNQCRDDE